MCGVETSGILSAASHHRRLRALVRPRTRSVQPHGDARVLLAATLRPHPYTARPLLVTHRSFRARAASVASTALAQKPSQRPGIYSFLLPHPSQVRPKVNMKAAQGRRSDVWPNSQRIYRESSLTRGWGPGRNTPRGQQRAPRQDGHAPQ